MNQNQRARKGFTLMEMLVVIAIIAVLVSVAIPSVKDYANRAACAANAANLRTIQAQVTLAYQNQDTSNYRFTVNEEGLIVTSVNGLPPAKKTTSPPCDEGTAMKIAHVPNPFEFVATYNNLTVEHFVAGAEGNYVPES